MARTTIATPGFLDRLGDRVVVTDRTGGDLEVLRLRPELTADAAFEVSLKARAEELASFQHRSAARIRGISRLPSPDGRLAIVSDAAKGWRLSEVLQAAEHEGRLIHTSTVLFLLRQVASVAAALQASAPGVAHGALGPERVVLSPAGRVLVVEYVLGSALEHLPALPAERMWKDLRLPVPVEAHGIRFGPHTDVLQLGIIALSLIHNRLLRRDEYPAKLTDLLDSATESLVTGARQPIGPHLRNWLEHALGLVPDAARWTMDDAQRGLDWIVSKEGGYFSTPVGLEPLLQSVERFFTVPSAGEVRPVSASKALHDDHPAQAAASHQGVEAPRADTPPSAGVGSELRHDLPSAGRVGEATRRVSRPATASIPDSVLVRAVDPEAPQGRVLTLVKPAENLPALPPATELIARTLPPPTGGIPAPGNGVGDGQSFAEPLLTTTSPLAEFAGERVTDVVPTSLEPETVPPLPPLRAVPPPTPSSGATETAEVGPVADMLAVDRPPSHRRSGWNNEAWLSRSADRQPSGARSLSPGDQTVRVSKSGGAAAAALRSHEAAPQQESIPLQEPPSKESLHPSLPKETGLPPAPAVASSAGAISASAPLPPAAPALNRPSPSTSTVSRPLFGVPDAAHDESAHAAPRRLGGSLLWPAVAALVILCGGGFAAWTFLRPSAPTPTASARREAKPPAPSASVAPPATSAAPAPAAESASDGAGSETAAVPSTAEARPIIGSLQFVAAIPVTISEKGQALGTSLSAISLPAGPHVLELANEEVGYRATRAVEVRPGRVTKVQLALPRGSININATPWAEVLVDGQRVGETPLANVQLTVGSHEVRFRHPQLGEQVRTVVVTTGTPGRLSVDMKQ